MEGVLSVDVDLFKREVTVEARAGKVTAEALVEAVNQARDSEHSFKARVKETKKKG